HYRSLTTSSVSLFFHLTPTPHIYTLSLHDALPISASSTSRWRSTSWPPSKDPSRSSSSGCRSSPRPTRRAPATTTGCSSTPSGRSEEHTSELQSRFDLVCRLLLEKKNKNKEIQFGD